MKKYEKKVSVIMGIYNQRDQEILLKAVDSVLQQTFRDFEFIIYNDGSDQKVTESINRLNEMDDRIKIIGADINHGLAFSLNACIEHANGEYIARMDADDLSMPERLQKQVDFMDTHPEYMWCGTNAMIFDENGVWGERKMPEAPEKKDYLKYSPYIHPTVMYRACVFESTNGYLVSKETLRCEDYEIFMRLRKMGYKGYNIQENLFQYREDQTSYEKRKFKFRLNEAKIRYRNFKEMKLLFPIGWLYVARPVLGGLIPTGLIAWMKRKESGYKHEAKKAKEPATTVLQADLAEESVI